MTPLSRLFAIFPAFQMAAILAAAAAWVSAPSAASFGAILLAVYGLPVASYRVLAWILPIKQEASYLDREDFAPWWAAHQTQAVLNAVPQFEAALRLVPGLFSAWLRLWGSRIGAGVYWTPMVEIVDRDLLEIGDRVVIGAQAVFCSHVIKPGKRGLLLYVKAIRVGAGAFVSASSRFGPGAQVAPGAYVPFSTDVYPNRRFPAEAAHVG